MLREAELSVISLCGRTSHKCIFLHVHSKNEPNIYLVPFLSGKKSFQGDTVLPKLEEDLRNLNLSSSRHLV